MPGSCRRAYDPRVTVRDDHGDLPDHAVRLVERLESIRSHFVTGPVGHHQHNKYAERAGLLAEHLSAAMLLSEHRR